MTIVDANVLLNAINRSAPDHETARRWLDKALSGATPVGFAWVVLLAVLRISTRAGLFARPLTVDEVTGLLRTWLAAPSAVVVNAGERHLDILAGLLGSAGVAGNITTDAHLAALALERNASVTTFDADFDRFAGVTWARPVPA